MCGLARFQHRVLGGVLLQPTGLMVGRIYSFVLLVHRAPAVGCESQSTQLFSGEEFMPPTKQRKSILTQDIPLLGEVR